MTDCNPLPMEVKCLECVPFSERLRPSSSSSPSSSRLCVIRVIATLGMVLRNDCPPPWLLEFGFAKSMARGSAAFIHLFKHACLCWTILCGIVLRYGRVIVDALLPLHGSSPGTSPS
eukprot:2710954-Amphidinium_carterae.1